MSVLEDQLKPQSALQEKKLVFPKLYYPFPEIIDPETDSVHEETIQWAIEFELIERGGKGEAMLRSGRFAELIGRLTPDMKREGFVASTIWTIWILVFDDYFCEAGALKKLPAVLAQVHLWLRQIIYDPQGYEWEPLCKEIARKLPEEFAGLLPKVGRATADMAARIQQLSSPSQYMRWMQGMMLYFLTTVWECQAGVYGEKPPSVQQYLTGREGTGGFTACAALAEMAAGYEIPENEFYQVDVRRLQTLMAHVGDICNDIFSLPRENGILWSVPTILIAQGMTPQNAVDEAARIHNSFVHEYLTIQKRVKMRASHELRRFLHNMDTSMRGHYEWERRQKRYMASANFHFDPDYDVTITTAS